jgi:nucleotide-binding universal stress UspA family protein
MRTKPASKTGGVPLERGPQKEALPGGLVFNLKKILVPVDFSDCSKKALQYAIPFATQFDSELTILHVVQPYPAVPEMAPVDVETLQDGRHRLEGLRETIGTAVRSTTSLRTGEPHLEIAEAARELGIDLIILSTHGRTGLAHMFHGSTAEKVIRHAPCPVLIVRESEREFVSGTWFKGE